MKDERIIVAQNIAKYRKNAGLTQLEFAEKLNYSDKAISKWERGDSLPDFFVMKQMADIFGISLENFFSNGEDEVEQKIEVKSKIKSTRKFLISLMSCALVWLVAMTAFVTLGLLGINWTSWYVFIYAIPVSAIVLLVFSAIWKSGLFVFLFESVLIWSIALCLDLCVPLPNSWLFYLVCIPLNVIFALWFWFKSSYKISKISKKTNNRNKVNKEANIDKVEEDLSTKNTENNNSERENEL